MTESVGRSGRIYRVEVPAKPAAKGRARFSKSTGRAFTPKQTIIAEAWVRMCCVQQVGTPRVPGPVAVRIVFTMAIPQSRPRAWREAALAGRILPTSKPDWDNLAKLTSDALNGIAWVDDAEVASARVLKRYGPVPATSIAWWTMGEGEAMAEAASAAPARGAWAGMAADLL